MDCYLCDNEATQRCSRCGNPYCGDHGEDLCADCLNPVNATPSGAFFRASLLALLLGSVLALWLLIRPPGLPGESTGVNVPEATPLPPQGTSTPSPTRTPVASATAAPTATATPTLAPTAEPTPAPIEYTVLEGDTWYDIAFDYGVDAESLAAYNGLTLEDLLQPGQVLTIPQ